MNWNYKIRKRKVRGPFTLYSKTSILVIKIKLDKEE